MVTDEELALLASQAVDPSTGVPIPPQPGAGTGATLGLDLSAFPANVPPAPVTVGPPAANGIPVEGPVEVPGDRSMASVGAPVAVGQPIPGPAPLSAQGGVEALGDARTAAMGVADAKAAGGPLKAEESRLNADAQSQVADQARQNAVDIQAEQNAIVEGRNAAQKIADSAAQEYKNFKYSDWWGDKTDGERIRAKIFVGLGAFAAAGSEGSGKNAALDAINTIIDQNHRREVAENKQLYDFSRLKAEGVEQFMAAGRQDMANLQIKNAARYQASADEAKAQLIRNGIPADEAENDVMVRTLRANAEKEYAKGYGDLVKDQAQLAMSKAHLAIARGTLAVAQKNSARVDVPAEHESKSGRNARAMALGMDNFEKSGMSDYVPSEESQQRWFTNKEQIDAAAERNKTTAGQAVNFTMRKLGQIPVNDLVGLDGKDKQYFTVFGQIVEPYARDKSGAAIAAHEWKNFAQQMGLGGDPAAGRALREATARDLRTVGGRATKLMESDDRSRGAETPGSKSIYKGGAKSVTPRSIGDFAKEFKL